MTLVALVLLGVCALQGYVLFRLELRIIDLEVERDHFKAAADWRLTHDFHEMYWHGRPFFVPTYPPGIEVVSRTPTHGQRPECN